MKTCKLAIITVLAILASGCVTPEDRNSWRRYWLEETGTIQHKDETGLFASPYARDYIQSDGTGIAIPAKAAFDLYISPFAPTSGYVASKKPEGSTVKCPFTGRRLVLGSRKEIKERELPQ